MTEFALRVSAAKSTPKLSIREFLWRPRPLSSSFQASVGPRIEQLGPISELHADLVRLAVLVYLVDRTAPRPRTWERDLDLTLPVSDPDLWQSGSEALEDLLRFLSGDWWILNFEKRRMPRRERSPEPPSRGSVCLLSGGADSLAGAILLGQDEPPALVSHSDWRPIASAQKRVLAELEALWGGPLDYQRVRVGRQKEQLGTGEGFEREGSSRTRSFLFIALGLAAASIRGGRLLVPENGYASLNVPLAGERRGALSTRTTHPGFLLGLEAVLRELGLTASIENPLAGLTKGGVFGEVKKVLGAAKASRVLSKSSSCAKPGANWSGLSPDMQCGVCFGCLVRRAAFVAAGLKDRTAYVEQVLSGQDRAGYLTPKKLSTYQATRFAVKKGVGEIDILALGLPDLVALDDALKLARDGLSELAAVQIK